VLKAGRSAATTNRAAATARRVVSPIPVKLADDVPTLGAGDLAQADLLGPSAARAVARFMKLMQAIRRTSRR